MDISFLMPFAAGNFIYIGASDLIPEVKKHDNLSANLVHFIAFVVAILLMLVARSVGGG
jgi:zinc and cadmium transporter